MKRLSILIPLLVFACARGSDERGETAPVSPAATPAAVADSAATPRPVEAPAVRAPSSPEREPARGPGASAPAPATPPPQAGDSATLVLERAATRYAALRSLQADFTMTFENSLLRTRSTGHGVLLQKRPDKLLLRFSDPAGDIILSDGEFFWVYYPSVDREQAVRTAAGEGASGVDLQAQFLGDPTRRFQYTLDGEERVAGRAAWLMTLVPRERTEYRRLRVWIDREDALVRRFEIMEDNGSVRRFELRNLRPDATIADAVFRFEVPAGVRVITR